MAVRSRLQSLDRHEHDSLPRSDSQQAPLPAPEPGKPVGPQELAAWAERAVAGDGAAAGSLVTALAPQLLRVIRASLGATHPEIEDVLQESLIRFLKALPSFRDEGSLVGFAVRIAVHAATDQHRRDRAMRRAPLSSANELAGPESQSSVGANFVQTMLEKLPPAQAEALVLRVVVGYSVQEIAAATGVPLNTARSRLLRAKEALRRLLEVDTLPVLNADDSEYDAS
jgi:RNA polymerase sigma-70 factor (ECF subfamily)